MKQKPQIDPTQLWGFGPAGWVCLVFLLGASVYFVSGGKPVVEVQQVLMDLVGLEKMQHATIYGMMAGFTWKGPSFSLVTLGVILIALAVQPRRIGWYWYVGLALWAFARPTLVMASWRGELLPPRFGMPLESELYAVTVVGLLLLTRSWVVGVVAMVLAFGAMAALTLEENLPIWGYYLGGVVFNGGLLAVLLWWAIGERRRWRPIGHCFACGYDVQSVGKGACPECGVSVGADGRPASLVAKLVYAGRRIASGLALRRSVAVAG